MLEEAGAAAARGARVHAEVLGHGAAFAAGGGAGGVRAAALARAIRLALADAGVTAEEIGCLSAAANGSVLGDRDEALGIMAAFGPRAAELPIAAIKSSLGEALGASGALQAVDLVEVLAGGVLSGIAGLERLEEGLALGGAQAAARSLAGGAPRYVLATALAAGGHCSALVLGGGPDAQDAEWRRE
jgi:3-oxoacyl-(acyl-carrier-protein) synthase